MNCLQIMAVRVDKRETTAVEVQKVLTEYGCSIRTRLGLHDQPAGNGLGDQSPVGGDGARGAVPAVDSGQPGNVGPGAGLRHGDHRRRPSDERA